MLSSTGTSDGSSAESIAQTDANNISQRLTNKVDNNSAPSESCNKPAADALTIALATDGRETWDKKIEFLLAVIGFAVDLGNVWRFPYVCYANGGGAFLIPYCIMLIFGGLPLFYMELALGQYYRSGCITIWRHICPALKGIGYAICIIDLYVGMHYNTIISWAVYYLVQSFRTELPWISCKNDWNTPDCRTMDELAEMGIAANNQSEVGENMTSILTNVSTSTSPAKEYYERQVLEMHLSDGLERLGDIRWPLVFCVLIVFILVYFSLWKGVRSTGKAVWITALAPYCVLFILLGRGITLEGAEDGIRYYLTPKWEKLYTPRVWIDAATQIFFSLGPGFGTLLALSSYNKFHNNCYRDAIITSTINCLTSFLAGFVIFSVVGYMAKMQNKQIDELGIEGPGLIFIVYPEAIANMIVPNFWSIIFFLMLITLGLDSTFGGLEAIITALCDEYPTLLGRNREVFVAVLLVFVFIGSLPTCTQGGYYLVNFLTTYGPGISVIFVVFVEAAAVCWLYGTKRFSGDIERMIGKQPSMFWKITWQYISPVFILIIFIFSFFSYEDLNTAQYQYPKWSIIVGWMLTLSSIICVPLYIVYMFIVTPGSTIEVRQYYLITN
ncbi:Sodium-dependent serotonin transporter [Orchesella cincta]|uniref:Transporter n=1 Tax=Orchesella cincta TaxID=48709 RepID=A0A1D2NDT1_ORCCI|nr:Sodium-dependent serotonin transporter [Orchesella cincta]